MERNGALVHTSVFHSSAPRLFYGRGEYDLLFNVDVVNLLLKNNVSNFVIFLVLGALIVSRWVVVDFIFCVYDLIQE